jgi:hypothetical protein
MINVFIMPSTIRSACLHARRRDLILRLYVAPIVELGHFGIGVADAMAEVLQRHPLSRCSQRQAGCQGGSGRTGVAPGLTIDQAFRALIDLPSEYRRAWLEWPRRGPEDAQPDARGPK